MQRLLELFSRVDAKRRLRPRPFERLDHDRIPVRLHEPPGVVRDGDARVPRARQARSIEELLHPGLVAEVPGRLRGHPLDAETLAHDRERDLKLLVRGEQAVDTAEPPSHLFHRACKLFNVQHVADPPVLRDRAAQGLG
jgi:hypothetical protein